MRSWEVLTPSLLDQRAAATASAVGGALTDDWPKGMVCFVRASRVYVRAALYRSNRLFAPLDGLALRFFARQRFMSKLCCFCTAGA